MSATQSETPETSRHTYYLESGTAVVMASTCERIEIQRNGLRTEVIALKDSIRRMSADNASLRAVILAAVQEWEQFGDISQANCVALSYSLNANRIIEI